MAEQPPLRPELREQMGDWVTDYAHRRQRTRRRLRMAGVSALAVGVAVALGASAWVVLAPRAVIERHVTCFEAPSASAHSIESVLSSGSVNDPAGNAVSLCANLWQLGVFQSPGATPARPGGDHPVPPLTLCTRTDGTYVVFPREANDTRDSAAFCDALGFTPVAGH